MIKYILALTILFITSVDIYSQLRWPISNSVNDNADIITSVFGPRSFSSGAYDTHWGMDINKPKCGNCSHEGDNIYAPKAIRIESYGFTSSVGYFLEFSFYDEISESRSVMKFLHLKESAHTTNNDVIIGDDLGPGTLIGKVGSTGPVTGPHLHIAYYPNTSLTTNPSRNTLNPLRLFNNNASGDMTIDNESIDVIDDERWVSFDVSTPSDRLSINSIEVSFFGYDRNGSSYQHDDIFGDPIIDTETGNVCDSNNHCWDNQLVGIIDFDNRIGISPNNSNPENEFNGVKIVPAELNNSGNNQASSGEVYHQLNDHKYRVSFKLDNDVLENLIGGLMDIEGKVLTFGENAADNETVTELLGNSAIHWTQKWEHPISFNQNRPPLYWIKEGGNIFIKKGGTSQNHIIIEDDIKIYAKAKLELEAGTTSNRAYLTTKGAIQFIDDPNLSPTLENIPHIVLGDHSWLFSEGTVEARPNGWWGAVYGEGSEWVIRNGKVVFEQKVELVGLGTCIRVEKDGELVLKDGADLYNGGIIMADSNATIQIDGILEIEDDISGDGYALDISEGTTFKMGYNSKIIVKDGAKVRANGSLANPIKFTYSGTYDPGVASWDGIELRGDGNIFEYTILEHAITPLYFRSDDNVVEYSTVRNNSGYGIRTNSDYSGGWGSVTITDSDIHDNGSHGVYFRKTHGGIQYSNVKDNDGDGVYIYDATVGNPNSSGSEYFRGNDIQDNNGSAVELAYNATLYDGYSSEDGNNNLGHNGSHEVYLSSSSARWNDASGGSYTAVLDNTSSKFVYNLAQTTSGESTMSWEVGMENNAWNYTTPSSSKFHGDVDYLPFQTGQMFGSIGPRGGTPSEVNDGGELPQMVLSAAAVEAETSGMSSSSEKDAYLEQTREINKLMATINGNPQSRMVAKNLNGLIGYYNQLPESKKSEFDEVPSMLRSFIADRQLAREVSFGTDGSRLTSETALMLQIHQTLQDGDAQIALNEINKYKATFSNLDIKRELGFIEANALEQLGQYDEAIAVYNELAILSRLGIDSENTTTDYETLVTTMEELRDEQTKQTNRSVATESTDKVKEVSDTKEEALPTSFALNEAYPNPFNPSTTFSFEMPQTGVVKVEVFDITGRMVSVLTNKRYEAGRHSLQFNAEGLASGVYLVRANLAGTIQSQKVTLIK